MNTRRIPIADEPGKFINRGAAKRLVSLGRAAFTPAGTLRLISGAGDEAEAERVRWSSYSHIVQVPGWSRLGGYLMNGAALNRSEP